MIDATARILLGLLVALCVGCSVNPVTGENEFSMVSAQQEVAIGEKNYRPSQQSQGGQYLVDPALQAYVAEVGNKLAAVSDVPRLPYEFVLLNNSVPNAWALPGGKIAINRGLLILLDDESELAAVLGHEVVHAAARHGASQMTRGMFVGLGAQIAVIAAQTEGYGQLAGLATQLGGGALMAKYGRDDELESDRYGMEYMSRAGYSPQGAVRLQEVFVSLKEGKTPDFLSQLFASHPPSQERVAANRARAATLPPGEKYRQRYQRGIAQIKRDQEAYEAHEKALAALKEEDADKALSFLDQAIAIQPDEGQFWELRGHAWQMLDNTDNAEKAFSAAIRKSPGYFSPVLYRGFLRYESGRKDSAYTDLKTSYELLPTHAAAYYLGEISLANGDTESALNFYRNASGGQGELGGKAQARVTILELPEMPDKYVLSKAYIGQNGYLNVAVKNASSIDVSGVKVQLAQWVSNQSGSRQSILRGSYRLSPGQQIAIETGIGPFTDAAAANAFRARVVAAKPAKPGKSVKKGKRS